MTANKPASKKKTAAKKTAKTARTQAKTQAKTAKTQAKTAKTLAKTAEVQAAETPHDPPRPKVRRTGRRRRQPRRKSTVVITGITGRLGQLLARRLHRQPHVRVIGIDRRSFHRKPRDVEHLQIDIRRKKCEELFRTEDIDVIFHLGLMHDPRQNPDEHHSWNLVGTQRVFEYAQRYRVPKVVLLSSADVYGPQADNPTFIGEDAPLLGARRFHQIRDLISVDMLSQSYFWKAPEIETVVLRPVHILGGVRNAMSKYLRMARVPVLMGYDPMMQVIHEEDAVRAILLAATPGVRGVFNVVGPQALPLRKLIGLTGKETLAVPHVVAPTVVDRLYKARLIDMPSEEIDFIRYPVTLDGSRAEKLLKFHAHYSVQDAVASALREQVFDGAVEPAKSA